MFQLCVDVCTVCVLRNTLNMCWMRLNSVFFLWKKKKEKKSNAEIVRHIRVRDYPRHCKAQRKQKSQICIKRRRQIARKNVAKKCFSLRLKRLSGAVSSFFVCLNVFISANSLLAHVERWISLPLHRLISKEATKTDRIKLDIWHCSFAIRI